MIDFEQDQQNAMKKTDNIQSLADQVERLETLQREIDSAEEKLKQKKKRTRAFIGRSYSNYDE